MATVDRHLAFMSEYDRTQGPGDPRIHHLEKVRTMTTAIEQETSRQERFLRLPEVLARTGLSRSTIYVQLDHGRFPRPVSLGRRAVGWIEAEVDEWIRERITESRGDTEGTAR